MKIFIGFLLIAVFFSCSKEYKIKYPDTKKVNVTDDYHGTVVADPYRWLEDNNSEETAKWIEEQNKITEEYLSNISFRNDIKERLTELWNYERYSMPEKVGKYYFFYKNNGLQEQSVVYKQEGLNGEPKVFIDPNKFSDDGSVSLTGIYFSNDNKYCGYGISRGGSDWQEYYILDVETGDKLSDEILWVKFSGMSWYKDGFFYSRYDEPKDEDKLKAENENHKVYYHKIGTAQSNDELIYQDKNNPKRNHYTEVTEDEKYLILYISDVSSSYNLLYYKDLRKNEAIKPLINNFEANYSVIDNIGDKFLILTDFEAPNFKLVLVDTKNPAKENWQTIIPESENSIRSLSFIGNNFFVSYMKDATTQISVFDINGKYKYNVELPTLGQAYGFEGKKSDRETFYTFTSFTYPPTIYRYNIETNKSEIFRESKVNFTPSEFETKQVFYNSKDGTKIPLFIVHKKGLKLDGNNPTILYGYGGFNIAMLPSFSIRLIPLLENDVVYAMACLRGGSEYGENWHKAGMLDKKQNVFDDFISAAEYLIQAGYTTSNKLGIWGGSNGGLLIGACINQRPDLFKVAFPAVGVMDMLRFHKFTIGWAWVSEYGSSDDPEQFEYLFKYSPLHNIKEGLNYPATFITTADHDDRVFPAHSFKYAATLQEKYKGENPILIRIETKVGHGAGTSTSKQIELYTDMWSFFFKNVGVDF